jgi:hypothetical protein
MGGVHPLARHMDEMKCRRSAIGLERLR